MDPFLTQENVGFIAVLGVVAPLVPGLSLALFFHWSGV